MAKKNKPLQKAIAQSSSDIAQAIYQIDAIEVMLTTVRDLTRLYTDISHGLPEEEEKAVMLDAGAMRGTMTFFAAQLEDAIESLQMVHGTVSSLQKISRPEEERG